MNCKRRRAYTHIMPLSQTTKSARDGSLALLSWGCEDRFGSFATGWNQQQIQQCPKCPVSDGRPEKGGLSRWAKKVDYR
jgi:hypothetical protein